MKQKPGRRQATRRAAVQDERLASGPECPIGGLAGGRLEKMPVQGENLPRRSGQALDMIVGDLLIAQRVAGSPTGGTEPALGELRLRRQDDGVDPSDAPRGEALIAGQRNGKIANQETLHACLGEASHRLSSATEKSLISIPGPPANALEPAREGVVDTEFLERAVEQRHQRQGLVVDRGVEVDM